jgi:hypothetical protein
MCGEWVAGQAVSEGARGEGPIIQGQAKEEGGAERGPLAVHPLTSLSPSLLRRAALRGMKCCPCSKDEARGDNAAGR